jgi:thioredoxin reductase (NADPH)
LQGSKAMTDVPSTRLTNREDQIYPVFGPDEIERLRRFGAPRRFGPGEAVVRAGETGHGLSLVLSGSVDVTWSDGAGSTGLIVSFGPGSFMGEIAQLTGRPALVDARAQGPVEALVIEPGRLRALLVAEAEIGERIMRALILRRVGLIEKGVGGPVIVGPADNSDVLRLEGFLTRNGHPYQRLDCVRDPGAALLVARFDLTGEVLPLVVCPGGEVLRNPGERDLARCLGMVGPIDPSIVYDAVIVGAGPAGLAAAVYAGSEGLSVLVLDCRAFGGQAGASARIENYLGFPTGISGLALMARAFNQAVKFGVDMAIPEEVVGIEPAAHGTGGPHRLQLAGGDRVSARTVVIANGARYRHLDIPEMDRFGAFGVHYWASPLEARICAGQNVVLVGAGNSAGQAVVYLAEHAASVVVLVRGESLGASMSRYLVERIEGLRNVEIRTRTQVTGLEGEGGVLDAVRWRQAGEDQEARFPTSHLFLFIGAEPRAEWLADGDIALDRAGFVLTGAAAGAGHPLETSMPGVFAIGDVRSGSVKRVASAVGEGAQVVAALHQRLATATVGRDPARRLEMTEIPSS